MGRWEIDHQGLNREYYFTFLFYSSFMKTDCSKLQEHWQDRRQADVPAAARPNGAHVGFSWDRWTTGLLSMLMSIRATRKDIHSYTWASWSWLLDGSYVDHDPYEAHQESIMNPSFSCCLHGNWGESCLFPDWPHIDVLAGRELQGAIWSVMDGGEDVKTCCARCTRCVLYYYRLKNRPVWMKLLEAKWF